MLLFEERRRELPIFKGTLRSPKKRMLKHPKFVHSRAYALKALGLSGEDTVDHCLNQILFGFEGTLLDYAGHNIDLDAWELDELWGEDAGRTMNRYKQLAYHIPKQRLHDRLLEREMAHDFAVQIYSQRLALSHA